MKLPFIPYDIQALDKDTQNEFTAYLEEKQKPPPQNELTSHGGKLSDAYSGWSFLGAYNPETVTISTFDKMRKHPQIAAGLAAIKLPILATNWSVSCEDDDIAAFSYQTLKPLWRSLIRSTLTAIDFGFSAHEKVWEVKPVELYRMDKAGRNRKFFNKTAVIYKKIKSLHPEWVTINTDALDNFLGITQIYRGEQIKIKPNKSFIFTHQAGENFGNLFGTSRLKNIYDVWYWWSALSQFMLRYFERRGSPLVVVRFPSGKTKEDTPHATIAMEMGKAAINDMTVTLPSKTYGDKTPQWDMKYLQDEQRGEMFVSALNSLEIKMLRGLFVPERVLTQDLRTGSYALSRTHFNVYIMSLDGLVADLEDQFTRYIIRPLIEYNFGANAPSAYLEMERLSQQRREFLAKVLFEMAKTGMVQPAIREIARELRIPIDETPVKPPEKPQKPGKPGEKEPEEPEEESEQMSLEDKKKHSWWRKPFDHENPKVLEDIESTLDRMKGEFSETLNTEILSKQLDMVLKEVDKALTGKQPLKNIWFRQVKTEDGYGRKQTVNLPWEPMKAKLQTNLNKYHKDLYLFGQKTAIEEMDLKDASKTDTTDMDVAKGRAKAISDRWISNIKYGTEMVTLVIANKTNDDIKWDIKQVFEKFRNKNLPDITETEGMWAINLGRRRIVKRHS